MWNIILNNNHILFHNVLHRAHAVRAFIRFSLTTLTEFKLFSIYQYFFSLLLFLYTLNFQKNFPYHLLEPDAILRKLYSVRSPCEMKSFFSKKNTFTSIYRFLWASLFDVILNKECCVSHPSWQRLFSQVPLTDLS